MSTTDDRLEKWRKLSKSDDGPKVGGIVPAGDPNLDDDLVVPVDEDWMASQRPGYVDPTEDLTDEDVEKIK